MRLRLRLCLIFLNALYRRTKLPISGQSVLRFMVMPWDCVIKRVGNDRYHAFMDLGRIDLIIRLGWSKTIYKSNWKLYVITSYMRYRYPLKCFERFILRTQIIYVDKHFIWMKHVFESKGEIVTTAISKNAAISKRGIASITSVLNICPGNLEKPVLSEDIRTLCDTERILRDLQESLPNLTRVI